MKFWLKRFGSSDFIGPLATSDIQELLNAGTVKWDDEALEASGQSFGTLKRSTDWVKLTEICPPDALATAQAPVAPSMQGHASLEFLRHVRRNTCYPALRSMIELLANLSIAIAIIVGFGLCLIVGLLSQSITLVISGLVTGVLGCLFAIIGKQVLLLLADIADIVICQNHGKPAN